MLMESTLLYICTRIIVALSESVLCLMQMIVTESLCWSQCLRLARLQPLYKVFFLLDDLMLVQ